MNKHNNSGKKGDELTERFLDFAVRIIKLIGILPKTVVANYIAGQIMRSGTSPGSNYEEACGAESKADFIHKLGIVLKELKESRFWLRLIRRTNLMKSERMGAIIQECNELCAIVAKSILTARGKK